MTKATNLQNENKMYGSFHLNQDEFALEVKNIHEVVNSPEKLVSMPLAPKYVLGIFNLRGLIIPVIDLKFIFEMETDSNPLSNKKIAIVEFEGIKVGLLFDSTGQIFRNKENEKNDFKYDDQKSNANVVSGAIKLDGGKRIVQILNAQALLKLEKVPLAENENFSSDAKVKKAKAQRSRKQCISFFVAGNRFGMGIETIHEIIKVPSLKASALSVGVCLGILDLRGDIIPVVDFAGLLKYREPQEYKTTSENQRILVLKFGNEKVGLLIDSVESIISYYLDELLHVPVLSSEKASLFLGCLSKDEVGDVILLKSEEIFSNAELNAITQGHSNLYKSNVDEKHLSKLKSARKTYITFKIDNLYALEMHEVKELIEYPANIIRPPGLSKFIKGMLNLRGIIVTILDVRALYNIESNTDLSNAKILIFEKMGVSYGLIVDSVEHIVSFSESEQLKLPAILQNQSESKNGAIDIKFAVALEINSEKKNIFVLNLGPLAEKTGLSSQETQPA